MDLDGFYVTLVSNSSMNIYPDNTKANFITNLYKGIKFDVPYEVGVVEISHPIISDNIESPLGKIEIHLTHDGLEEYFVIDVTSKHLNETSLTKILSNLNEMIKKMNDLYPESKRIKEIPQFQERLLFPNQVIIKLNNFSNSYIYIFGQLADILGFPKSSNELMNKILPNLQSTTHNYSIFSNMQFSTSNMFVYSNIIKYQFVGDVSRQLLRVVYVDGKQNYYSTTYPSPHYVPILTDYIETIKISIKDDKNQFIQFKSGSEPVIIKLHFKPKRYGF